jgi:predicted alpha/beta superfamily hydrolase
MINYIGSGNPVIYLFDDIEGAKKLLAASGGGLTLGIISDADWNRDLSPWKADKVFRDGAAFTGGGDLFLQSLTAELIPEAEKTLCFKAETRGIVGYSLAGLFSLYAFFNSDLFSLAGSVSGSLWFDAWDDYIRTVKQKIKPRGRVYLSVGGREGHARNPRMKCVENNTRLTEAALCEAGVEAYFELNEGGHFDDTDIRMLKCLTWLKNG